MWEGGCGRYDHSLLRRCKFAVGLLSGRYSQPPKEDTEEGKKEEEAKEGEKKKPKVGPRVTCLTHPPTIYPPPLSPSSPSFPPPSLLPGSKGYSCWHVQNPHWQRSCRVQHKPAASERGWNPNPIAASLALPPSIPPSSLLPSTLLPPSLPPSLHPTLLPPPSLPPSHPLLGCSRVLPPCSLYH